MFSQTVQKGKHGITGCGYICRKVQYCMSIKGKNYPHVLNMFSEIQSNLRLRPPLNYGHLSKTARKSPARLILISILIKKPLQSGHLCTAATFWGLQVVVAVVDRFDCSPIPSNVMSPLHQELPFLFPKSIASQAVSA